MTPSDLIDMIKILSALESWGLGAKETLPGYLHDDLNAMINKLTAEILKGKE